MSGVIKNLPQSAESSFKRNITRCLAWLWLNLLPASLYLSFSHALHSTPSASTYKISIDHTNETKTSNRSLLNSFMMCKQYVRLDSNFSLDLIVCCNLLHQNGKLCLKLLLWLLLFFWLLLCLSLFLLLLGRMMSF